MAIKTIYIWATHKDRVFKLCMSIAVRKHKIYKQSECTDMQAFKSYRKWFARAVAAQDRKHKKELARKERENVPDARNSDPYPQMDRERHP